MTSLPDSAISGLSRPCAHMACSSCGQRQKEAAKLKPPSVKPMFKYVMLEEQQRRYSICKGCPKFRKRVPEILSTCRVCGCVMGAKTWLEKLNGVEVHCPLEEPKW